MTDFKPMLAKDADLTKIGFPQIAQPKLDGIRASVVAGKLVSRTLKPIPNAEIREALERPEFEGFDGELVVGDPTAEDCYRKTSSFVMAPNKTGEPWAFHAFDLWNSEQPYALRASRLGAHVRWAIATTPEGVFDRIKLVQGTAVNSMDELDAIEALWLEDGMEGVILRDPAGRYKFGRSGKTGPLLKVKRFSDSEAVIVGSVEEQHNANEAKTNALGRTERSTAAAGKVGKGTLGKLLVRDRYSGVEFSIGTGFTAQERADLWAERDSLPGRVVRYKFFAIGVKDKPRHPVMQGFRAEADLPDPSEAQAA